MEDASQGLHLAVGHRSIFRFLHNITLWLQGGLAGSTHGDCCKQLLGWCYLVHSADRQTIHTAICPSGPAPGTVHDEGLIRGCRFIAIFWGTLLLVPTAFSAFRLFCPTALPDRFYFYLSLTCIAAGIIYTSFYKRMKRKQREAQHL
jgi:hypothetical protein